MKIINQFRYVSVFNDKTGFVDFLRIPSTIQKPNGEYKEGENLGSVADWLAQKYEKDSLEIWDYFDFCKGIKRIKGGE